MTAIPPKRSMLPLVALLASAAGHGLSVPSIRMPRSRPIVKPETPGPWDGVRRSAPTPRIKGSERNKPCRCGSGCKAKVCSCRNPKPIIPPNEPTTNP